MAIDRTLPWLGFPPAVDLANTIVSTPSGQVDLLTTTDELAVWVAAEMGRIPHVASARRRLDDVRELRDCVHALLHARAAGRRPPRRAVTAVNAFSRECPVAPVLRLDGTRAEVTDSADPFAMFRAAVARSAVDVVADPDAELTICGAPSCGMLFLPDHGRQTWCSASCGNRARVARHAARVRAGY